MADKEHPSLPAPQDRTEPTPQQDRPFHVETREVLGAAYLVLDGGKRRNSYLTHAAVIGRDGLVVDVLCRRVSRDNLADATAGNDVTKPPTCRQCLVKLRRVNARKARMSDV